MGEVGDNQRVHPALLRGRDGPADRDATSLKGNGHADCCWASTSEEGGAMPSTVGLKKRGSVAGTLTLGSKTPIMHVTSKSDLAKRGIRIT